MKHLRSARAVAVVVMATMVTIIAGPAPARASTITSDGTPSSTVTVDITPTDIYGTPTNWSTVLLSNSTAHPCTGDTCTTNGVSASYYLAGSPSWNGCAVAHVQFANYSVFGFTTYKWEQWSHWCWGYGTVYNFSVDAGMTHADGAHQLANVQHLHYWYVYNNGPPNSGRYDRFNAEVSNCFWICAFSTYPYSWIRVHGNGTISFDWGYN